MSASSGYSTITSPTVRALRVATDRENGRGRLAVRPFTAEQISRVADDHGRGVGTRTRQASCHGHRAARRVVRENLRRELAVVHVPAEQVDLAVENHRARVRQM